MKTSEWAKMAMEHIAAQISNRHLDNKYCCDCGRQISDDISGDLLDEHASDCPLASILRAYKEIDDED